MLNTLINKAKLQAVFNLVKGLVCWGYGLTKWVLGWVYGLAKLAISWVGGKVKQLLAGKATEKAPTTKRGTKKNG